MLRSIPGGFAAAGLAVVLTTPAMALEAGVARRDITPETGRTFFGYVREFEAEGVALRLFARALVLKDGDEKVALVTTDLGTAAGKPDLISTIEDFGCFGFDEQNVLYAGTHTHAGQDVAFGIDQWVLDQIAEAICTADATAVPARAAWGSAPLFASFNRSIEGHLANHGMDLEPGFGQPALDPDGPGHTIDRFLRLLRIETFDGTPIAAWGHYSTHPTAFIPENTLYSADLAGSAVRRFEESFGPEAPAAIFTNGNEGDQIPLYDDYNQHAVSDRMGKRIARAMRAAWDDAGPGAGAVDVDFAWTRIQFGADTAGGNPTSQIPWWGLPFLGGAENGPSYFYHLGTEGTRRPAALADPVHGRKILAAIAPFPPTPEIQVLRIGEMLLLGVPGEPTVQMGRRLREGALGVAPAGVTDALIVGLASQYTGYFTTPEEYDQQHYEGGHTIFGKWSGHLLRDRFVDVTEAMVNKTELTPASNFPVAAGATDGTPPPGNGDASMQIDRSPDPVVERMNVVTFSWTGSEEGRDRPLDAPFLILQQDDGEGGWTDVETDLGRAFVWTIDGNRYAARYDTRPDLPTGTYRIRIQRPSDGITTAPFDVVPSNDLRILGARGRYDSADDETNLLFLAQNPPPRPDRNVLHRKKYPTGGSLAFDFGGMHAANWDPALGGWTATVPGDATAATVDVPAGGLVDGNGNTSGDTVTLTVGRVEPVDWPPPIGIAGGGKTPGPFGIGTVPP